MVKKVAGSEEEGRRRSIKLKWNDHPDQKKGIMRRLAHDAPQSLLFFLLRSHGRSLLARSYLLLFLIRGSNLRLLLSVCLLLGFW